jgi:predicted negative regulator of RcsB-dependent stress response
MAYNLEEQEQLDAIKAWWERYGRLVVIAVVGAIVAIGGVQGWRYYRATQATAAAALFDQLQRAERGNDAKKIRDLAGQIVQNYASSGYAALAALAAAKNDFDTGDSAAAKARLQWVIDNAADQETRDVARLRLARILFDDKKQDEALQQLAVKPVESFSGCMRISGAIYWSRRVKRTMRARPIGWLWKRAIRRARCNKSCNLSSTPWARASELAIWAAAGCLPGAGGLC